MKSRVNIKRVYEPAQKKDGYRVLVDRLWPRGVKKEDARIDEWMKYIAPSPGLRKWFGHQPERWGPFSRAYRAELKEAVEPVQKLADCIRQHSKVTLIYAARDEQHTHALVLHRFMEKYLENQNDMK